MRALRAVLDVAPLAVFGLAALLAERKPTLPAEIYVATLIAEGAPTIVAEPHGATLFTKRLSTIVAEAREPTIFTKFVAADRTGAGVATVFAVALLTDRTITTHFATRTMRLPTLVAKQNHSTRVAVEIIATFTKTHAEAIIAGGLVAQAAGMEMDRIFTN